MKIGILTGGGDVPGLNSAIKGVVEAAHEYGFEVLGFKTGWQGLLNLNALDPESVAKYTLPLNIDITRKIDRDGGTFLHTSRINPSNVKKELKPDCVAEKHFIKKDNDCFDCTAHVLNNLENLGIDVLIPIGGDDTLSYGERLYKEGFNVVGIPKTMDNDVHGTEYCLGFASCVSKSVQYINDLRTSIGSHERIGIIEVMGRNAGFTALIPSYLASVKRCIIAESPFDMERVGQLLVEDKLKSPSNYSLLVVSEGAVPKGGAIIESGEEDPYGHKKLGGVGKAIANYVKKELKHNILYQALGYQIRCGRPDPVDVMVTYNFARIAVDLIAKGQFGRLVRINNGVYDHAPMSILSGGLKRVDIKNCYNPEDYTVNPKALLGKSMYYC